MRTHSGRPYSEFFMVLPPREVFPDYYQLIEQPIAFSQLQSKVKKGNYSSNYDGFIRDVSRVFQNAKTYNDESALVYDDALVLEVSPLHLSDLRGWPVACTRPRLIYGTPR